MKRYLCLLFFLSLQIDCWATELFPISAELGRGLSGSGSTAASMLQFFGRSVGETEIQKVFSGYNIPESPECHSDLQIEKEKDGIYVVVKVFNPGYDIAGVTLSVGNEVNRYPVVLGWLPHNTETWIVQRIAPAGISLTNSNVKEAKHREKVFEKPPKVMIVSVEMK